MRAPLSIVIPTLNPGAGLAPVLGALGEGLEVGILREVIVTDAGSSDGTAELVEASGAQLILGEVGRGQQLNRGAEAAQGAWLLFLHADTILSVGWAEVALQHFKQDNAGYCRLQFRATGIGPSLTAGWANLRSKWFGLPYGDQGLLISRALYDEVGGFQDIPLMEDVAIARALKGRLVELPITAYTSADRYEKAGWLLRGTRNLVTLLRYLFGASPVKLAKRYRR